MKAYLKVNPIEIGIVTRVYYNEGGQKRMEVRFPYSVVDADISNFELIQ